MRHREPPDQLGAVERLRRELVLADEALQHH
jgi:hypothetical protein